MIIESKVLCATPKKSIRGRFQVESLEGRTLLTAVSWIATTSGDFNNPANWSTGLVPGVNDNVTINNSAIQVTIDSEKEQINSLDTNASIVVTASNPPVNNQSADLEIGSLDGGGGGVRLEAGATLTLENSSLNFDNTQALQGHGTVRLLNGGIIDYDIAEQQGLDGDNALTIGNGITIQGSGEIGPWSMAHHISVVIQGNIIADTPGGTINLNSDDNGTVVTGTIAATAGDIYLDTKTNATGPLAVSGTGTLDLGYDCSTSCLANLTRDGGTINVTGFTDNGPIALGTATGSLNLTALGTLSGNTVTSTDGAQIVCDSGATLLDVTLGAGSPIDIATNSAVINVQNNLTLTNSAIDLGSGSINFQGSDHYVPPDYQSPPPQIIGGSGTITMGNGSSINVVAPEVAEISPSITIDGGGGSITIDNLAQTLINQGTISADTPGGTITVNPNGGTFTSTGTLAASNGGTLAIQGDYALNSGGTTNIGIGPSGTGTLAISGAATLAGTLNVTVADGFVPPGNQTYDLITYASMSGAFAAVNTPTLDAGAVTTSAGATAFTLTTPPPTIAQLTAIVADDRSSLAQSKSQRLTTLHDLIVTRNQQQKSLGQAKRTLASLTGQNRRHPSDTLATEIAAETSTVSTDSQALAQTRQTLSTDIRTDFTDEHPAMKKLLADIHTLHQATRHARHGG